MKNFYLLCLFFVSVFSVQAQEQSLKATSTSQAAYMREIPALSKMDNIIAAKGMEHVAPPKRRGSNTVIPGKGFPKGSDPLARQQQTAPRLQGRAPTTSFGAHEGTVLNDPTGAIGPNHYVYAFNSGFGILDRSGNVLLPEASLGTLFPGETLGDPVVVYDRYVDRFVIMEFSNTPNGILIAVCKGPDPVNDGWYTYRFNTGSFPDYEKMSIWSDGYYITSNKDSGSQTTSDVVFAVERDEMLAGNPNAQMIGFPLPGSTTNGFFSPGGFNALGSLPPVGVPQPIVYMQDDAWSGVSQDHLKIWNVSVDWNTPSNSSISTPQEITTSPFDAVFDNGSFRNLDEPGSGPDIDAIQATMMYMTNYRRFATHNSAVMNFVVDITGNDTVAGVRWYELRQSADGQPWTIYQEGTYTQPDGHSAFCASMSMDALGNIGMGYTIVSSSVFTSLRYTGRQASDPLGTMTVAEQTIVNGDSRTNRSDGRYGDYSQLTVDPTDDMTFWHIAEYMKGPDNVRKSHVAAFKIATGPPDTEAPSNPTNLTASNTTATTTDLSWTASTDNIAVAGYDIYNGTNVVATASSNSTTISGLSPTTTYSFSVVAKDAAGNQSSASNTVSVTTLDVSGCTGGITAFPYSESFENNIGAWTQSSNDDLNWLVDANGTPSSGTGPSSAVDGSDYIYVEASGNGTGYPNKRAIINSPCFNFESSEGAALSFQYHMYGSNDMGTIALEASIDDGLTWNSIWNETGNKGNQWNAVELDLASYLGGSVQFRFNRVTGSTWQADIAIDAISVVQTGPPDTEAPSAATNLTASNTTSSTTDLAWNAASDNVGVVEYDVYQAGTVIGSSDTTTFTVTGLSGETTYEFYVVAKDAAGNVSGNSNTVSVTTLVNQSTTDVIHEGFFETGLDGWIDGGGDCARVNSSRSFEGNYSVRIRDNSGTRSSMTLPNVDLTAYDTVDVEFHFYPNSMENGEDFWLRYYNGSSWTTVETWARGTDFNNGSFYTSTVTINAADYNFASNSGFRFQCDASANGDQIYIDAVVITASSGVNRNDSDSTPVFVAAGPVESIETHALSEDAENNFKLYPNPVKDVLNVKTKGANIDSIEIFSMFGMRIEKTPTLGSSNTIDVSDLAVGTYFIRFTSGEDVVTRKFIKK